MGGSPTRRRHAGGGSGRGQILVDSAVASQISDEWAVEPVPELVDLAGKRLKGWRVVGRRADVEAAEETLETR